MKTLNNILKVFLLNFMFIGSVFSATTCPALSIEKNYISPASQAEAVIGSALCALIQLKKDGEYRYRNVLELIKKQVIPFIDIKYTTELVLDEHWEELNTTEKKVFEKDLTKSLVEDYVSLLVNYDKFESIYVEVDKNIILNGNKSEVKIYTSTGSDREITAITLKMIRNERKWRVYDLIYQTISILDIERMSYGSKIYRYGLHNFIQKIQ
ncbi:MAG: ABC transporter substrate-binding protein [Gammaproteobacteria bacterium]|nr:ABC transporter substrate-binding protein [Gammaproteobacteria bacterium]